jgi:hypothetical protein
MDFLILFSSRHRVVLEVEGKQHYANGDTASPALYSEMVSEDRRLRLAGYEVYRFGGAELILGNFFYRAADPNGRGGQGMHKDALNLPAPCYWCCSGRLKLSDDQVLLVLRWPSQAVRRPGVTGVALAVSSCPTTRCYCNGASP